MRQQPVALHHFGRPKRFSAKIQFAAAPARRSRAMLRLFFLIFALISTCLVCARAEAGVIVFANRTDDAVTFAIAANGEKVEAYRLAAGDVLPLEARGPAKVRFSTQGAIVDREIAPNSICDFSGTHRVNLDEQRFGEEIADPMKPPAAKSPARSEPLDDVGVLPVMILVDEDEPAVRRVWETRLKQRVNDASKIFEHHCRMRFEVVAVDTWESTNAITDFSMTLREFERKVRLKRPARLAIGFTSQYRKPDTRRVHLGGTRGPLHSHLLVREWSQHITEPELLEVLVHELGHVLGACHSPDSTSVMRPLVGDRQSCDRLFRIGFDPINTLALYVFCEQIRLGAARLDEFDPGSRALLASVYTRMNRELPDDTSAAIYLKFLQTAERQFAVRRPASLNQATASVVRAVARAARMNQTRPAPSPSTPSTAARLQGDALTDYYFRAGASEAKTLPDAVATKAFLLGLVVALDRSDKPENRSPLGKTYPAQETQQQRLDRLAVLGRPTIHGREDLLRHFTVSAAMCVSLGDSGTETLAALKEIADSHGTTGFCFADLAADLAGIELAKRLDQSRLTLDALSRGFEARQFVPPPTAVPQAMDHETFRKTFGGLSDPRFREQTGSLRRQVLAMPGFRDAPQG